MKREADLYPLVASWLRRRGHCFAVGINKGLRYSRIDVVGVRDVGGELSGDVEVIAVEVKAGRVPFATACGQAAGYRIYADRAYYAEPRLAGFDADEISIANQLGVGLIQIRNGRCTEVLSSPAVRPPERYRLPLLEALGLGRCQICDCVFQTGTPEDRFSRVTRENVRLALRANRGVMFWNHLVGPRKLKLRRNSPGRFTTFERRFICPDCVDFLAYVTREFQEVQV